MVVWLRSPESLGHRGCADPDEVLLFHPHKETPPEFASMSEIARAMGAHANCAAETLLNHGQFLCAAPGHSRQAFARPKLGMHRCMVMLRDDAAAVPAAPLSKPTVRISPTVVHNAVMKWCCATIVRLAKTGFWLARLPESWSCCCAPPQSHWGAVIVPTVVLLPNCVGDTHCWTITNASALRPATLTKHFFAPRLNMRPWHGNVERCCGCGTCGTINPPSAVDPP